MKVIKVCHIKMRYDIEKDDYLCEIWGASTKHPDIAYRMRDTDGFEVSEYWHIKSQVFQWLMFIASQMSNPLTAIQIADYACKHFNILDWS